LRSLTIACLLIGAVTLPACHGTAGGGTAAGAPDNAQPAASGTTAGPAPAGTTPGGGTPASGSAGTAGTGLVRGTVLRPPGRDPRSGGGSSGNVPVNGDPVHAYDQQKRLVATVVSAGAGTFELTLAPGTYRFVEDICGVEQQVVVRGQSTTAVNLMLPTAC
jgi:hypothetical protein